MPLMELLEEIWIHFEQIQRGWVRQCRRFHETEKQKKVVQLGRLTAKLRFVATECRPTHEIAETLAKFSELLCPRHDFDHINGFGGARLLRCTRGVIAVS